MSELCLSSTPKKTIQVSSLILSDLHLFFSFVLSHPLYFFYFIFFSPYLLKLLSYLSPLFVTTSLLLLGFLTVHDNSSLELSESKLGFLLQTYHAVMERLRPKTDDEDNEFHYFEELEAYKIVFDTSTFYAREKSDEVLDLGSEENCFEALQAPVFQSSSYEISGMSMSEVLVDNMEEKTVEIAWEETTDQQAIMEEKRLEGFLKVLDEFENRTYNVEEKKVDKIKDVEVEFSIDNGGEVTSKVAAKSETFDAYVDCIDNGGEYTSNFLESPSSRTLDSNLGSYGSMRREKEWKRTLACKLFEERHNVDSGGEGMDLLWETYEADSSNKAKPKINSKKKKNKKRSDSECYVDNDDEEEDMNGQLCCLQALKFSTGKMNLGMGRPNLMKISKAIKGIGWLHHVTKHGKKGYN
ncbi:hypothetical protein LOK49_LG15G00852 [Camellia lanceoleosa]|uniref:Uncharacterized protein n=1 Tax=Camellia lanceoleosa TaxID=1840588 RepID=A0ACC0F2R4_9ERIC|nr:hypothetical protein LOK49_LG15G00852 [Camellia lanceoleosa]